jgi:hypothetical protein
MSNTRTSPARRGALLAINLLFVMVWGFAAIDKLRDGVPAWFPDKFGKTFLSSFPGLSLTFWTLAASETLAFVLGIVALLRLELLGGGREPRWLTATLVWSLFVFLQLGFGQWLTAEFNGAFQQFVYFTGTLVALQVASHGSWNPQGSLEDR